MTSGTCAECGRTLIRQVVWLSAPAYERAAWKRAGNAVQAAPGKCRACYQRAYRRNLGCAS